MSVIINPSESRKMPKDVMESLVDTRLTSRQIMAIDGLIDTKSRERDSLAPIRAVGEAIGAPATNVPTAVRKGLNPKTKRTPGIIYPIMQN